MAQGAALASGVKQAAESQQAEGKQRASRGQDSRKEEGGSLVAQSWPLRPQDSWAPSTHLSTDSTNTLRAFMWIQATKASLKFTLSQRSRGPCRDRTAT